LGPSSVWYSTPTTKLMLLHFAELVQWELAAAEWVAAVVVVVGKKTFLFFWIFSWSLSSPPLLGASECAQVGCIVSKSATKLQLVLVTVSCCRKSFSNWAFNVFHTWFGTNCRGNCETLFSIQGGGKRHLFFSSSLQRACVRPEFAGSSYCRLQPRTVAPLASSSLLRQHVGADLVNGWLRWVASTMLLWSVWCCACCFLYTGAVVTADGDCVPCVNRPG